VRGNSARLPALAASPAVSLAAIGSDAVPLEQSLFASRWIQSSHSAIVVIQGCALKPARE